MPATYTVIIDDNDNITTEVLRLTWRLGMERPHDSRAAPITAEITVRNPMGSFSPEVSSRDLAPGTPVQIQSTLSGVTRTHFTGSIDHVEPMTGDQGAKQAVIHAAGPEPELMQSTARLPLQVNRRADQIMADLIDSAPLRLPDLTGRWLLGLTAQSELAMNTRLPDLYPRALEAGVSTFVLCADTWDESTTWDALGELIAAERGRLFIDRAGQIVLLNRHHTLLDTTALTVFTDSMDGLDYRYGADHVNRVTVNTVPRATGSPASTLWTLATAQRLPGVGQPLGMTARFRDSAGRPLGAVTVLEPVAGVDWQANTRADGTGQDRTGSVFLKVAATAAAATLEFITRSSETLYILTGARLRGTPIIQGDPLTVEAVDLPRQNQHGAAAINYDLPALTAEFAADLARFELARRANPRGQAGWMTLRGSAHLPAMLTRTLFDRISITESQTGHTADYFIIAEEHTVEQGGLRHQTRWLLEPTDRDFWRIASGTLDQSCVLAY
jgi:hypothetical protein